MSLLYLRARPIVAFDANNPEHRRYYRQFIDKRSWGTCPVRFMAESLNTDLLSHINREMLSWYVKHEFKNATSKNKNAKNAKPKSSGSLRVVRRKQPVQAKTNKI
jgi:hypothetical protein